LLAVHDRDGRAPVALAADQPVAQAVADGRRAEALRARVLGHPPERLLGGEAAERPAVEEHAVVLVGRLAGGRRAPRPAPAARPASPAARTCARTRGHAGRAPARP